jgi:hypothetical protein
MRMVALSSCSGETWGADPEYICSNSGWSSARTASTTARMRGWCDAVGSARAQGGRKGAGVFLSRPGVAHTSRHES